MRGSRHFPSQLTFLVTKDMEAALRAIAYYQGERGMYSKPAKEFIGKGIQDFLAGLTPKEKKIYDEILQNVLIKQAGPGIPLPDLPAKMEIPVE